VVLYLRLFGVATIGAHGAPTTGDIMTTSAPTVVKTITEAEIRDVTHYCHWIAARQGKRSVVMYRFPEYTPCELLTTLLAARSQTRQPLLRIRTTREPVARQLPQRRNAGRGDEFS